MRHSDLLSVKENPITLMPSVLILVMLILLLGFFPSVGVGIFYANSNALGLFVYCIILSIYLVRFLPSLQFFPRSICVLVFVLMMYSVIQVMYLNTSSVKSLLSLPIFLFIATSACVWAAGFNKIWDYNLSKVITIVFIILTVIAILNIIIAINFLNYTHYRSVVPFIEASHFALYFGPISIMTALIQNTLTKRFMVAGVVLSLALSIPSMTLLVYTMLIFILLLKFRLMYFLVFGFLILLLSYVVLTTPYFLDRILISNSNQNLTYLVYFQGVYDAYNSLVVSNYLGLGFQLLGTQPRSEQSYIIERLAGIQLNREDGGFLAAKILAEFGILGAIFILYYLKISLEAFVFLKKQILIINNRQNLKHQLVAVIIFAFSVELFVRGAGYFSSGVFLFIFALFYYKKYMRSSFSNSVRQV